MSPPVFCSSFFVLPPYRTVHFCPFPSTRKYQYRSEQKGPLRCRASASHARGHWLPRQNGQFSSTTHTHILFRRAQSSIIRTSKFGYNKESENFVKRKSKKSNECRHRRLCDEAISASPVRINTHPRCPKKTKKTEKQAAMLDLTAHDSLSSSMPTPGNEKSDVLGVVRLSTVADEASPLSFPINRRKLRIF